MVRRVSQDFLRELSSPHEMPRNVGQDRFELMRKTRRQGDPSPRHEPAAARARQIGIHLLGAVEAPSPEISDEFNKILKAREQQRLKSFQPPPLPEGLLVDIGRDTFDIFEGLIICGHEVYALERDRGTIRRIWNTYVLSDGGDEFPNNLERVLAAQSLYSDYLFDRDSYLADRADIQIEAAHPNSG